jgi:glycosyltransferase involved in cell wall biosynthesis
LYNPSVNQPHPILYILHSSEMYGTERMALATAAGLPPEFKTIFLGPRGPAMWEAERQGYETHYFQTTKALLQALRLLLQTYSSLTVASTLPRYTIMCKALNVMYRRQIRHVYVLHGSCQEEKDFGGIRYLNPLDVRIVAVSQYVKQRLIEHGFRADRVEVAANFLLPAEIAARPRRGLFTSGVTKAISAGRLVPVKRFDLLFDAAEGAPELRDFPIDIVGDGPALEALCHRAQTKNPHINVLGFTHDLQERFAQSDLLVHTCPTEAFGLVVIEAMAAHIPVLVPDQGGPASFIEEGVTGFKYRAGDAADLAKKLIELRAADPALLNRVVDAAAAALETTLSAATSLEEYRKAFAPIDSP